VEASDPDGDALRLSAVSDDLPGGWSFTDNGDNSGSFNWTPGFDDEGDYTLTVTASDASLSAETAVDITVIHVNRAPVWDDVPRAVVVNEGAELRFSAAGSDPDGDELTCNAASDDLPDGWEFTDDGGGTGGFVWTPSYEDAGEYTLTLTLSDAELSVHAEVVVTVRDVNRPPLFRDIPESVEVDEAARLTFTVRASDPDGDRIALHGASDDLPDGWDLSSDNDSTATFAWTPGYDDSGEYTLSLTVSDAEFDVTREVAVVVHNSNRPPLWNSVPRSVIVNEGARITFTASGSDPDREDEVTLSAASDDLPDGWGFTDNHDGSGEFDWTPGYEDAGSYRLILTVSDGDTGVDAAVVVDVHDVNRPPEWIDMPETVRIDENSELELDVVGRDPDGDDMIIFFDRGDLPVQHPDFVDNGDGSGRLTWRPTYDDAGEYRVRFTISDGYAETTAMVRIRVDDVNRAPVWTEFPDPIVVDEAQAVDFVLRGADPDSDEVTIEFDREGWNDAARFTYVGDGAGVFFWQTTFEDAGEYTARFILSDGDLEALLEIDIEVRDVNRPPVWVYAPEQVTGDENAQVEFTVSADDPDGDTLTISFASEDLPDAARFTDHGDGTADLHWETTYEDSGRYEAAFTVSDGVADAEIRVIITINDVNRPPVWIDVPDDIEAAETDVIEFTVRGMDRESDRMTLSLNRGGDLPEAARFTDHGDGSADFHWETTHEDSGLYRLEFTLADYQYSTVANVRIMVVNVNRPPYWTEMPDTMETGEGETLEFTVTGGDDDDDDLAISMQSDDLPGRAELTDNGDGTARFNWQPSFEEAGTYHAALTLSDYADSSAADLVISVLDVNRPPVWTDLPRDVSVNEGNTLILRISGFDPDGDDLDINYESHDIPDDARFTDHGDGSGELVWETGFDDGGSYTALFSISDGAVEVNGGVAVSVEDVDDPPFWTAYPRLVRGDEATLIRFDVAGVDPEGADVRLRLEADVQLPDDVEFEDHGDGGGTFSWRTDYTDAGQYSATFTISDDRHDPVRAVATILVDNVNRPPAWDDVPDLVEADEGGLVEFSVSGGDPDRDDQLTITFYPNLLPDEAEFTDHGDGGGSFQWRTGFEDAGEYSVNLLLSDGSADAEAEVLISVSNVNREPYWTSCPGAWRSMEGELIEFTITAEDPDGEELTLDMASDELPEEAGFVDNGDGTGDFAWRTGYRDAGVYHLTFSSCDGEAVLDSTCVIEVSDLGRDPVWILYPPDRTVTGFIDSEISVYLEAADPDSAEIDYSYVGDDLPDDLDVQFVEEGDGVRLTMNPDRFQHGTYHVGFTADDGDSRSELVIEFIVLPHHFLYTSSGRGHEIQIDGLDHFGDEMRRDVPAEFDEIGVITTGDIVAGVYRFSGEEDMPLRFTAWGDDPSTEEIEGFTPNEPFDFVYWDHTAGREYGMNAVGKAGDDAWRLDGFSLIELFTGPALSPSVDSLDFGPVRVGFDLETTFTITNNGTTPVENLTWEGVEDGIFQVEDPPELLDIGERFEAVVSFHPADPQDYRAQLTARTGDAGLATLTLSGSGVTMEHFVCQRFFGQASHEINISQARLSGRPLEVSDEIGVFTPASVCAGAVLVDDERNTFSLFAWGDDPGTGEIEGFRAGEPMHFRFWNHVDSTAITAVTDWRYGPENWQPDGRSQVVLSAGGDHFTPIVTDRVHNIVIIGAEIFGEAVAFEDEVAAVTPRGNVAGGVSGIDGEDVTLEAYGDDPETPGIIEGFRPGELIYFRIWDGSTGTEYAARAEWTDGSSLWEIDGGGSVDLRAVRDNVAPAFRPLSDMSTAEADTLMFELISNDMDDDPVSIYIAYDNPPRGMTLADNGGGRALFRWVPAFDQAGRYALRFGAFDGIDETLMEVGIRVQNVNRPPVLAEIGDLECREGEQMVVLLEADDPDEEAANAGVDFSAENLPPGASMSSPLIRWTPGYDQAGVYDDVRVRVTDFGQPPLRDSEVVSISVRNVNLPPVWGNRLDPVACYEGESLEITLSATDPDGDEIRLDGIDIPEGAEFRELENGVGLFSWRPGYSAAGDYTPVFTAADEVGRADTLALDLTVENVNRSPILNRVDNVHVTVGETAELEVTASDPDAEDIGSLELSIGNPPPGLQIDRQGDERWMITWEPVAPGVFSGVRFRVTDNDGGVDDRYVVFVAGREDNEPPVITGLFPENDQILRIRRPVVRADIRDQVGVVDSVALTFDRQARDDFSYDTRTGRLSWAPEADLEDGSHGYTIRAFDRVGNVSTETVLFEIVTEPGGIVLDDLPQYTAYNRIDFGGEAQPFRELELWRSGELLMSSGADRRGRFEFARVPLEEGSNDFTVQGRDHRASADLRLYLDSEPPAVELVAPNDFESDPAPRIRAVVSDAGVGVDENSIHLALDGAAVDDFRFRGNTLIYAVPERLDEGEHGISLSLADLLGNARDYPIDYVIFIDTHAPAPGHSFFEPPVDTIANRQPEIRIPIHDPAPSSGIVGGDIVLSVDGEELDYEWDEIQRLVYFDFAAVDPLTEGSHEISVRVYDRAGNLTSAQGAFIVGDVEDTEPPEFSNLTPPPGCVAGGGDRPGLLPARISADTVSFVVGDDDAGVDWATVGFRVIALHDPDDPGDNDTTVFDGDDMVIRAPGRVLIPLLNAGNGQDQAPARMRGLEEGINQLEAFATDRAGNEGRAQWRFFLDLTPPETPELDVHPDLEWVHLPWIAVTGACGGDEPVYADGFAAEPSVRIFRNGELTAEIYVELENGFELPEVLLVEGLNRIEAALVDGGGNLSELSDPLEIRLDMTLPVIDGFRIPRGHNISDLTPEFVANLNDDGSGIDDDGISFEIDDDETPFNFDPESGTFLGSVHANLGVGEHTARLRVTDRAGNESNAEYRFRIILPPVATPEFDLIGYTSINRVSCTGRTEEEDDVDVVVILNGRAVGSVAVEDHEFSFEYDAAELPDSSWVTVVAFNPAGVSSDTAQARLLLHDRTPPVFSHASPADGVIVDADSLESISILIDDLQAGIYDLGLSLVVPGKARNFRAVATDSGYWLTADVGEAEFNNYETVEAIGVARDRAVTPNLGRHRWRFVTRVRSAPVISLPDTSFDEDHGLALNLHNYIHDLDNSLYELEITAGLLSGEDHATLAVDTTGVLRLNTDENWFGRLQLEVRAIDPDELSGVDTALVDVLPVNDPPRFNGIEDAAARVGEQFELQVGAVDVDGDELTFSDESDLFDISADGLIRFVPTRDMRGRHEIALSVSDEAGASDRTSFLLYVEPVNSPVERIADIPSIEMDEDCEPVAVADLDTVFVDADDRPLFFSYELDGEGVLVEVDQYTHILTVEPDADFFGEVNVVVLAEDIAGSAREDDFNVTVLPVNDPPRRIGTLPVEITLAEDPGTFIIADLDSVFIDPEEQDIMFTVSGGARLGVDVDENSVLSIDPDDDWSGEQTFLLMADDGVEELQGPVRHSIRSRSFSLSRWQRADRGPRRDESEPVEITVEIVSVNDPPRPVHPVEDQEFDEDGGPWFVDLSDLFAEVDGESFSLSTTAAQPLAADLSPDTTLILSAPENYYGADLPVVIIARDETGLTGGDTFYVDILPVNDSPEVISSIGDREFVEDTGPWLIADLDDVFRDIDGDPLEYDVRTDEPVDFGWEVNPDNELILTLPDNWSGADVTVTVSADDGHARAAGTSLRAGRTIRRIKPDAGPVRRIRSIGERVDGGSGLSFNSNPRWETGLRRDDTVNDNFMLTVTPVNDRPLWTDVVADVEADELDLVEITLTATDVDLEYEGDQLRLTIVDDEGIQSHGAVFTDHGDGSGTLAWQTDNECAGDYYTVFQVEDLAGEVDWWTVRFMIGDVNRPVSLDRSLPDTTFAEDVAERMICRLGDFFSDPDGDSITFAAGDPEGLILRITADGGLYMQPEPNWHGAADLVVTASDGPTSVTDTMLISVSAVNDPPTAFELIQPADSVYRYTYPFVQFSWQESVDIVEDSTVTYGLVLYFGDQEHWYRGLTDTMKWVARTDLVIEPDQPTEVRWWVWAYDGIDSLRSESVYTVTIEPIKRRLQEDLIVPTELALGRAFPNPFNNMMTIYFDLPEPVDVTITVHDTNGRRIGTLITGYFDVGRYPAYWDGSTAGGGRASSGLYFVRLKTGIGSKMRRVMLLR